MPASDSYGEAFGNRLNAQATSFVTRSLPKTTIAVTELRYDDPQFVPSTPPAEEDAFLIGVHLELYEQYTYWECGKPAPVSTLRPGDAIIYDVKRTPTFLLNNPFHSYTSICRAVPSTRSPMRPRHLASTNCATAPRSVTQIRSCAE